MAGTQEPQRRTYTWADYRRLPRDERWEIIGGEMFAMTPAPTTRHQRIVMSLAACLHSFLKGTDCTPYLAPTDLKLSDTDVVQPDLFVVCDPDQDKRTHVEGAPRLIIEVLGPSTVHHDRIHKLRLYARSGVQEVWLVTPFPSAVEIFVLERSRYRLEAVFEKKDRLVSPLFPDLIIGLTSVFDFPVDPGENLHLVKEGRPTFSVPVSANAAGTAGAGIT